MIERDASSGPSPSEVGDPLIRAELKKAGVWFGAGLLVALVVLMIQPILIICAGMVLAIMFDGGVRLLGRVLPIARGLRLLIVVLGVVIFLAGTFYLMGVGILHQVEQLRATLEIQSVRLTARLTQQGLMPAASDISGIAKQALSSVGRLTSWVGTAVGVITTGFFILALGLFFAAEPRMYAAGVQWLVPRGARAEVELTLDGIATTLRRLFAGKLLGMAAEGVLTFVALWAGSVPLSALLGIITGVLAFIPNIGSFISGVLMLAMGYSAGSSTGLWAIGTWLMIQAFDGYLLNPMMARRTVNLPPALTLGAQILVSALFGLLGLALADSLVVAVKVALERRAERVDGATLT